MVAASKRIEMSNSSSKFVSGPVNRVSMTESGLGGSTCYCPEVEVFEDYFFAGGE